MDFGLCLAIDFVDLEMASLIMLDIGFDFVFFRYSRCCPMEETLEVIPLHQGVPGYRLVPASSVGFKFLETFDLYILCTPNIVRI